MKADRDTFGPCLRQERERRGIALKHIAASTKIKESLFVELERGDFSNWPDGIFRRAHLCAYASAIGLPPQPILAEYVRLFHEGRPDDLPGNGATGVHQPAKSPDPVRMPASRLDQAWVVSFDAAAVCLMSSIVAGFAGLNIWPTIALVGLVYAALGCACFGQGIGTCLQHRIQAALQARRRPQTTAEAPRHEVQPIAFKQARPKVSQSTVTVKAEVEDRRASA